MRRGATATEVREAYLRRSKQLHPDRLADATPEQRAAATRAMQDVTAAYDALRDGAPQQSIPPTTPTYAAPWVPSRSLRRTRLIVIGLAVLALMSGVVIAGSGASKPLPDPARADDLRAFSGRCITLLPSGGFEGVVDCTRPHDARVVQVVDNGVACPIWSDGAVQGSRQTLCLDLVNP